LYEADGRTIKSYQGPQPIMFTGESLLVSQARAEKPENEDLMGSNLNDGLMRAQESLTWNTPQFVTITQQGTRGSFIRDTYIPTVEDMRLIFEKEQKRLERLRKNNLPDPRKQTPEEIRSMIEELKNNEDEKDRYEAYINELLSDEVIQARGYDKRNYEVEGSSALNQTINSLPEGVLRTGTAYVVGDVAYSVCTADPLLSLACLVVGAYTSIKMMEEFDERDRYVNLVAYVYGVDSEEYKKASGGYWKELFFTGAEVLAAYKGAKNAENSIKQQKGFSYEINKLVKNSINKAGEIIQGFFGKLKNFLFGKPSRAITIHPVAESLYNKYLEVKSETPSTEEFPVDQVDRIIKALPDEKRQIIGNAVTNDKIKFGQKGGRTDLQNGAETDLDMMVPGEYNLEIKTRTEPLTKPKQLNGYFNKRVSGSIEKKLSKLDDSLQAPENDLAIDAFHVRVDITKDQVINYLKTKFYSNSAPSWDTVYIIKDGENIVITRGDVVGS